ncbi:kelch repeat protein [Aspergillus alliaceus]|uniref:Kelch repeat protein n=1 Tax=Petromyces alliaceus TaxID=209559 RepID=A0A5N7CJ68_PETAA|nr:kelch repeat protein [Aspergillus alliaceus]
MVEVIYLICSFYILTHSVFAQINCTRTFHSAVINNGTLFIDGGEMHTIWPNKTITGAAISDLESIDLTRSWLNTDPDLFNYIQKPYSNHTGEYPPFLNEGASWSDGQNLYFYGGYSSGLGGPPVPPLGTWKYNIAANSWTSKGFSGVPLVRLCQGGAVQGSGKAYYLSGTLNPAGNPIFYGTPGADTYMDSGLISLDMHTMEWTNISTADMNTWGTIGDGYVSLLESAGDQGVIVAFGGYTYPVGKTLSFLAFRQNDTINQNSMELVRVYDIGKQKWYTQRTSGDIPRWRMSGCTVTAAAQDLSSYSIYIFGGMAPTTDESDGNIYVLSIPSFRWIRVYDDNTVRIKHKCLLAQKSTMLVIGGIIPVTNREYDPLAQNCDSAAFANGIGIFDLYTLSWMSNYNASKNEAYRIPSKISDVIGGTTIGGATMVEPYHGFNSTDMKDIFKKRTHIATPQPSTAIANNTSTPSNTGGGSLSGGRIAGVIIGSVAGVAMLGFLALIIVRRRKAKVARRDAISGDKDTLELRRAADDRPKELYGDEPHVSELRGEGDLIHFELPAESLPAEMATDRSRRGSLRPHT